MCIYDSYFVKHIQVKDIDELFTKILSNVQYNSFSFKKYFVHKLATNFNMQFKAFDFIH